MSAPVVVVGDVMTDIVARIDRPLATGSDTPAHVVVRPGGSAANTAAWLGALGVPVALLAGVGDDDAGREAERALRAGGVTPRLTVVPGVATGACVVLVDERGERTMLPDAGANAHPSAPPEDLLVEGGWLHLSGYALLRPSTREATLTLLALAGAAGMTTSIDPASAAPLAAVGAEGFRAMARGADVMLATLDEAEVLCGTRDPAAIAADLTGDHREVVLKLGTRGARWHDASGRSAAVPATPPPGRVVDTTGAGDAFAAGWLAARRAGADPEAALATACRMAARVVTRPGARPE